MSPKRMRLRFRHDLGFERTYFFGCLACVVVLFGVSGLGWRMKHPVVRLTLPVVQAAPQSIVVEDYFARREIEESKEGRDGR